MRQLFIFSLAILSIQACSFKKGPCNYEEVKFKAEITAINPYKKENKELYEIVLEFNNSSLYGSKQTLNEIKNIEIDKAFVERNQLRLQKTYTGVVNETEDKHCTKRYVSFNQKLK